MDQEEMTLQGEKTVLHQEEMALQREKMVLHHSPCTFTLSHAFSCACSTL